MRNLVHRPTALTTTSSMPIQTYPVRESFGKALCRSSHQVERLLFVLTLLAYCSAGLAGGVYKWVDEDGHVHYSDRAGHSTAEQLELDEAPAPDEELQARRAKQDKLLRIMEEERQKEQEQAARGKEEQAQNQQMCTLAKERLSQYQNSRFLFEEDGDGNRRRLSYAEKQQLEANAKAAVEHWCK